MRHVNSSALQSLSQQLESSRTETLKYQEQLNTGLRVEKPSDDPAAFTLAASLRSNLQEIDSDRDKVEAGQALLNHHDQALGDLTSSTRQMKNLILRAANQGTNQPVYDSIASEVNSLVEQALSSANTRVGKGYIFSGSLKMTKPFEAARQAGEIVSVAYQGDSGSPPLGLPDGRTMPLNLNGRDISSGGGSDFFQTAIELRDGLRDGTINTDEALKKLESIEENFVTRRSEAASAGSYLEDMSAHLTDRQYALEKQTQDLVGADPTTTATKYFASENKTQVSMALIGRRDRLNLIDYLR